MPGWVASLKLFAGLDFFEYQLQQQEKESQSMAVFFYLRAQVKGVEEKEVGAEASKQTRNSLLGNSWVLLWVKEREREKDRERERKERERK